MGPRYPTPYVPHPPIFNHTHNSRDTQEEPGKGDGGVTASVSVSVSVSVCVSVSVYVSVSVSVSLSSVSSSVGLVGRVWLEEQPNNRFQFC
jgi:hypothetical protein